MDQEEFKASALILCIKYNTVLYNQYLTVALDIICVCDFYCVFFSDGVVKLDSQPRAVAAHNGTIVVASVQHVSFICLANALYMQWQGTLCPQI